MNVDVLASSEVPWWSYPPFAITTLMLRMLGWLMLKNNQQASYTRSSITSVADFEKGVQPLVNRMTRWAKGAGAGLEDLKEP